MTKIEIQGKAFEAIVKALKSGTEGLKTVGRTWIGDEYQDEIIEVNLRIKIDDFYKLLTPETSYDYNSLYRPPKPGTPKKIKGPKSPKVIGIYSPPNSPYPASSRSSKPPKPAKTKSEIIVQNEFQWAQYCSFVRLKPEDFGRQVTMMRGNKETLCRIIGLKVKTNGTKKTIQIQLKGPFKGEYFVNRNDIKGI